MKGYLGLKAATMAQVYLSLYIHAVLMALRFLGGVIVVPKGLSCTLHKSCIIILPRLENAHILYLLDVMHE